MYTVNVEKECGCFKRSAYENNMSFTSKDDALFQATDMVKYMNDKFCGKHDFEVAENGNIFQISVGANAAPQASGGCCGGGHCS